MVFSGGLFSYFRGLLGSREMRILILGNYNFNTQFSYERRLSQQSSLMLQVFQSKR